MIILILAEASICWWDAYLYYLTVKFSNELFRFQTEGCVSSSGSGHISNSVVSVVKAVCVSTPGSRVSSSSSCVSSSVHVGIQAVLSAVGTVSQQSGQSSQQLGQSLSLTKTKDSP